MVISPAGFVSEHKSARSHKVNEVSRCCLVVLSIRTQASGPQFPTSPCRVRFFFLCFFFSFFTLSFVPSFQSLLSLFLPPSFFIPSLPSFFCSPSLVFSILSFFMSSCLSFLSHFPFLSYFSFLISFFFSPFLSCFHHFFLFTSRFVLFILAHKRSATLRYELSLLGP